ncbi:O-antigen/teichoic acid export membrane protein [Thiogranum longum]|uniref:O-antigen/teichoic acid export membrane protein n=1 Tax=Thiogranum longum TaxID=1537524 RepID=A0A4R1HCB1_9GAMM|nr:oligosaccharide flippase family protein [Thiogranum longum]TCK18183.1 O-antigen/teichoic acid export membrane protein [Thiogranum longum]
MKSIDGTVRILMNSAAMFAASILAKGGGLIVTILVARYLGATSLGVYAVVLAVALLLEVMTPVGHQEVIVRAIARDRSQMLVHWVNASATTLLASVLFSAGLVLYVYVTGPRADAELAVYVVAATLPFAGLKFIAQAVLQGVERMQYQTTATFVGLVSGLLLLWLLLESGAGVWSAFLSRTVFHVVSLVILARYILRCADQEKVKRVWRPDFSLCRSTFLVAIPFALQRFLTEGLQRLNIIILPLLITLAAVGQFNAAMQITQATSTIIPIMMLTLLPVFARSYSKDREKSALMAHKVLKMLLVLIFPFAFVVTVSADKIILLLFGPGYEASVPVLQIVIWSQVFFAADSVMKQKMIASDNERTMVWYSTFGLIVSVALTIVLGKTWGMLGVAVAVVLASAFLLTLNAGYVGRHIARINLVQAAWKPFLCALSAGLVAVVLIDQGLAIVLPVTAGAYVAFLLLFRAFSDDELLLFKQLFLHLRARLS